MIHFSIFADPVNANLVYLGGDRQDLSSSNYVNAVDYLSNLWWGDAGLARNGLSPSSQWKHFTHSNAVAGIPGGGTSNNSSPHADSWDIAIDAAGNLIGWMTARFSAAPIPRATRGAPALSGQFTTPVVVNSINAKRLIIGAANGLYESADQGSTVSRVSTLSPNDAGSGGRTMIYGGRKSGADNAEVIYFCDSLSIYRRTTIGGTLTAVTGYGGSTIRGIITDPEDYDHLIAIDNNQVFRSTDGGREPYRHHRRYPRCGQRFSQPGVHSLRQRCGDRASARCVASMPRACRR